ncbi:MAG: hypothetical protein A2W23_08335 [Planctomycetes bacterium RBG_16_43_13]|nr:MAG: hypothetical protein A2W23_08335 [Planctomycetes bacterium RBG_16_43_13]
MGLRINTNLGTITALRTLGINDRNLGKSLERLSTGLRINRGADDPSGLVISEQLRGQLRALNQSVTNSQNASNLISIADAALQEVSNLLVGLQNSIVFALNTGGSSPAQVAAEQDAVDQAVAAIDRIAATTRFSDRGLLNGTAGFVLTDDRPDELDDLRVRSMSFQPGQEARTLTLNVTTNPTRASVEFTSMRLVSSTGVTLRVSGQRGTEDVIIAASSTPQGVASAINSVAGFTGVYASATGTAPNGEMRIYSEEFGSNQLLRLEIISGKFTAYNVAGGASAAFSSLQIFSARGVDGEVQFQGQTFTGVGRNFSILTRVADMQFKLDPETLPVSSGKVIAFTVGNTGLNFQLNELPRPTDQKSVGIDSIATALLGANAIRDRIAESIAGVSSYADSSSYIIKGGFINSLITGSTNDLTKNPQNAANIVRAAIDQVATLRGFLGAIQAYNLQPNIDSLGVAIQNITSSLSSLRDLDYASEVATFTRDQILFQAGVSVLGNANAIPQSILTLLRG